MSLALRLVAEGRCPDDVVRLFSVKPGREDDFYSERPSPTMPMRFGQFFLIAARARRLKRGDIDWNLFKSMRRDLRLWIERALADQGETLRHVVPAPLGTILRPLSWKQYRACFDASRGQAKRADYRALNRSLPKRMDLATSKRNLARALRFLQRAAPTHW